MKYNNPKYLDHTGYKTKTVKPRCHVTHEPIPISNGVFVGGACSTPRTGYDIYVNLDGYSHTLVSSKVWDGEAPITNLKYIIQDMGVPTDPSDFKKFIKWLCIQLKEGKKIHVGCIGGHGRTGLVLAAILAQLGDTDSIATARTKHCKKAVESEKQVNFLVRHWGVKSQPAVKKPWGSQDLLNSPLEIGNEWEKYSKLQKRKVKVLQKGVTYYPDPVSYCINQ